MGLPFFSDYLKFVLCYPLFHKVSQYCERIMQRVKVNNGRDKYLPKDIDIIKKKIAKSHKRAPEHKRDAYDY